VHDAVVIGGGIAGLAAAWELRDRDVVVLEAEPHVGGRLKSERRGAYWLNFGAHVFAGAGTATDRLLRETGVEARDIPGLLTGVALGGKVVAGGRIETYPLRLPLAGRDRLALIRLGAKLRLGVARYDRILRTRGTQGVLEFLGDRTFAGWTGRLPADVDALVRPTIQRSSGEPEELAAGYGIGYFHLVWDRSRGLARNVIGGSAALAQTIAAALGERVHTATPVREVRDERTHVVVVHEHGELRARHAVLATQAHVTRAIAPDLPDETRAALEGMAYGPYVLAAFLTNERGPMPWDRIYAVAAARRSFNMLFNTANVLRDPSRPREPGGSLMVYSGASLARPLWDLDDAAVADRYIDDLGALFPGLPGVIEETVVDRWTHGLPYVRPGRARLQAALERPLGNLFLAGDYLGTRYTDTAISTGISAAERIVRT
jgi:oxygen-dependent protoporphyrinogen oxidase